jgi:hypothetical protein
MPNFSGIWTVTQQMQAKGQSLWPSQPLVVGEALGGGFFAGQISTAGNGIADYNLVVGPKSSAQSFSKEYKDANTATAGADSVIDGPQNTADIVADGNSTVYPAGHFCNDLVIGGFSDWYMPAKNELEVCYYNLKPSLASNVTSTGINANAVPARASNYTAGTPAQTSATDFKDTGTEFFDSGFYWSSTEASATNAWTKYFSDGRENNYGKSNALRVRAIRRVAV